MIWIFSLRFVKKSLTDQVQNSGVNLLQAWELALDPFFLGCSRWKLTNLPNLAKDGSTKMDRGREIGLGDQN